MTETFQILFVNSAWSLNVGDEISTLNKLRMRTIWSDILYRI